MNLPQNNKKYDCNKNHDFRQENNLSLELEVNNFFETNLVINEAKKHEVKLKNGLKFCDLACFFSAINRSKIYNRIYEEQDIILNGFSIKKDRAIMRYLQQNSLILDKNMFLDESLTVKENIKIVSLMFAGYDLSEACLSAFSIKTIANRAVGTLQKSLRQMVILSYLVCCPSIIWIIDNELLTGLSKNELEFFENAVKIRVKHGGVVIVVK